MQDVTEYLISKTPRASIEFASKAMVDALLTLNTSNRNIRPAVVRYHKDSIDRGEWCLTNQGVGVDVLGRLVDGQHRLTAIRDAGYPPVRFVLVVGLPKEAQSAVDIGAKRTRTDIINFMMNTTLHSMTVGALNVLLKDDRSWSGSSGFSPAQLCAKYEQSEAGISLINGKLMEFTNSAVIAGIIACTTHENVDKVRGLVDLLIGGAGLECGDPIYTLREYLIRERGKPGGHGVQRGRFEKTKRAITAALEGKKLAKLFALR